MRVCGGKKGEHTYNHSMWEAIVNLLQFFSCYEPFPVYILNFLSVKILIFLHKKIGK